MTRPPFTVPSLVFLPILLGCVGPAEPGAITQRLQSGAVALWKGEGDAADSVGAHHGLASENLAFVSGQSGQAFDLSRGHVRVAGAMFPVLAQSTVDFWLRPDVTIDASLASTRYVWSRGSYTSWIAFENRTGKLEVRLPGGGSLMSARSVWPMREWRRITVTYDGATHVLYVDGASEAALASEKGLLANDNDLVFGHASASLCFEGALDEVAVYDRALSPDEPALPGPVALWRGDGDATDSLGFAAGELRGGAGFWPPEGPPTAFLLDGVDDHVFVATEAAPAPARFTVSFRFRPSEDVKLMRSTRFFLGRGASTSIGHDDYGRLELRVGWATLLAGPRTTWPRDTWHQVDVTYDGSAYALYVDGAREAAGAGPSMFANNNELTIGAPVRAFFGAIDDVAIYDRVLASSEIACPSGGCGGHLRMDTGGKHGCSVRSDATVVCWGANASGQATPPLWYFAQVGAGEDHSCGVRMDGKVLCWGDNSSGQSTPPEGTFTQVSPGTRHTCGVRSDGTVACWGGSGQGESTPPAGFFTQVSAGAVHSCGVRTDGTISCWGDNLEGRTEAPVGTFSQVSAGAFHSCGLRTDGTVACWGSTSLTALGQNVPPPGVFTQVNAGRTNTCGLRIDGAVTCWGDDRWGQSTPPAETFVEVRAGGNQSCGRRSDGRIFCWGENLVGQLDVPPGQAPPLPLVEPRVSAGQHHTCWLKNTGRVTCWGNNGPLYDNTAPPGNFKQISASVFHTCALHRDGSVACWGNDNSGRAVPPPGLFSQVSAGWEHSCALKMDGTVRCWGSNNRGQLTPPAATFTQISAGQNFTCGVKVDGTVACWGSNFRGASTPPAGTFKQVAAGGVHGCGLRSDDTVVCWGGGPPENETLSPPGTFTQISTLGSSTCALRSDGSAECWGGQLITSPPGTFKHVSPGAIHVCGMQLDDTVVCFGDNRWGQTNVPPP
jgi:alpha-tubulin suppressor-like RCC1 family protein